MDDDIVEEIRPYIQEILHIVLSVKGKTLREFNELVGQTSKFDLHSIISVLVKVTTVQNYHVEIGGGEAPSRPICVEFKHLRRSGRLPPTKRTYAKMEATNNRTGRLAKKNRSLQLMSF
jgi:hypothetical protein